jgi:hypothetical protein
MHWNKRCFIFMHAVPITLRTTMFNIKNTTYIVITRSLCVLYGSSNRQQILPYRTLQDWFLLPRWSSGVSGGRVFTPLPPKFLSFDKANQNTGFTKLQFGSNHWLGVYRPQIPVLTVLCTQLNLLNPLKIFHGVTTPTPKNIPGYATELESVYRAVRTGPYISQIRVVFNP